MKLFDAILASTIRIRKEIHESAKKIRNNIRKAQDKHKKTEREESFICMAWSLHCF